ncbi:hypothetical protein HHI36_012118 [Cryptolaemus montrouzieri]|uniref:Uncharacterized protein n=1 Tax=Cryptolaemus montrouzieri TaxID=559131 RepID=A0ABD2NDC2_9CUCU
MKIVILIAAISVASAALSSQLSDTENNKLPLYQLTPQEIEELLILEKYGCTPNNAVLQLVSKNSPPQKLSPQELQALQLILQKGYGPVLPSKPTTLQHNLQRQLFELHGNVPERLVLKPTETPELNVSGEAKNQQTSGGNDIFKKAANTASKAATTAQVIANDAISIPAIVARGVANEKASFAKAIAQAAGNSASQGAQSVQHGFRSLRQLVFN